MVWPEGVKAAWAVYEATPWVAHQLAQLQQKNPDLAPETYCLNRLPVRFNAYAKVLAGEPLSPDDLIKKDHYYDSPSLLLMLPDRAAVTVWNGLPPNIWYDWNKSSLPALVARHELNILPGLLAYAAARLEEGLALALPFRCADFAPLVAHALKNLKKARPNAVAWLRAHPETAITALIPPAFGADRQPRDNAQYALRWLAQNGHEPEVRAIAARYGDTAADAVDRLLGADPALIVPAKLPKLPGFFVPAAFRRPVLADGGALPLSAVEHLGQMFGDYEIIQPFKQLGRETYAPTEAECRAGLIERFKAKKVATGSMMGLINRGWERGQAQDAGWVGEFVKRLPGGLEAELQIEPGTIVGEINYEPEQAIPSIQVRRQGTWDKSGLIDLATLDPILVSEIIRDADLLAPIKA